MDAGTTVETPAPKDVRLVITASALGTVFEWYDFFLYGSLAAIIASTMPPKPPVDAPGAVSLTPQDLSGLPRPSVRP